MADREGALHGYFRVVVMKNIPPSCRHLFQFWYIRPDACDNVFCVYMSVLCMCLFVWVNTLSQARLWNSFINSDALSKTQAEIDFLRIVVGFYNLWYIPFWTSRSSSAFGPKDHRTRLSSEKPLRGSCRDLSLFCGLMLVWPVSCWRVWASRQHVEVFATEGDQPEKCRKGGEA